MLQTENRKFETYVTVTRLLCVVPIGWHVNDGNTPKASSVVIENSTSSYCYRTVSLYPTRIWHLQTPRDMTSCFFSRFDFTRGYWKVPVAPHSRELTAFSCESGLCHLKVCALCHQDCTGGIWSLNASGYRRHCKCIVLLWQCASRHWNLGRPLENTEVIFWACQSGSPHYQARIVWSQLCDHQFAGPHCRARLATKDEVHHWWNLSGCTNLNEKRY